ncbi:MAG: CARDB domain-containing protein [Caldilineaceae bacterium]
MNEDRTYQQRRLWRLFSPLGAIALALIGQCVFARSTVMAAELDSAKVAPMGPTLGAAGAPLCRFGANNSDAPIMSFDTAALRIGWYIDYHAVATPERPNGIKYAPLIHLQQTGPASYTYFPNGPDLQQVIAGNLGADWFIGNEPDRIDFQDDMEPAVYALAYHELYALLKTADPTAHIFAGSIVQPTPLRLQYLDKVLASYFTQFGKAMPVDGWAIHNFILNEASCAHYKDNAVCWGADIPPTIDAIDGLRIQVRDNDNFTLFKQQIVRFRQWMKSRGYGDKPVYLSEYGVLMPNIFSPPDDFPPSRVNAFMNKTFDYLLNTTDPLLGDPADGYRLIQRLSWYSMSDNVNFNGYLFEHNAATDPYHLSEMGSNYAAYTAPLTTTADFAPIQLTTEPTAPLAKDGKVTLTLKARIANSGNAAAGQSATVRFYDKNPAQGGVQIGADQTVALPGCGATADVTVQWLNVAPASYQVYVSIDAGNTAETNKINNVSKASVFFATTQIFLPFVPNGSVVP